jgi:hypothetical protein
MFPLISPSSPRHISPPSGPFLSLVLLDKSFLWQKIQSLISPSVLFIDLDAFVILGGVRKFWTLDRTGASMN